MVKVFVLDTTSKHVLKGKTKQETEEPHLVTENKRDNTVSRFMISTVYWRLASWDRGDLGHSLQ